MVSPNIFQTALWPMSAAKALPLSCIYLTHFDDHNDDHNDGIGDGDIDDIDDGGDIDGIADGDNGDIDDGDSDDGDSDDSDDGVGKKVAANSPQLWIPTSPALTCSS